METLKKAAGAIRRRQEAGVTAGPPGPAASSALEQSHGWAAVARDASERCRKGADAEAELARRRNGPGE